MVQVEEIKSRIAIEDILADEGIHLKNGRCPCPIHGGSNPTSFSVSNGLFYCFACGESGDVISLTQKLYGLNFKEALKHLAQKLGISDVDFDKQVAPRREPHKIDWKAYIEKQKDDFLDLLIRSRELFLKRLEENLRSGKISLTQYYAYQQWADFELSRLDEESILRNYEKNRRKKARWKKDC